MASSDDAKTVCVTGISGYMASSIVTGLLRKGYYVRGTVRDLKDTSSYDFLEKIASSSGGKLSVFQADLLAPGSYEEAIQGCTYVIHNASVFHEALPHIKDPQTDLIDPAVIGTENVLNTVARTPSVKRVVVTSSVYAVIGDADQREQGYVYSEKDWNTTSTLKDTPYNLSKTLAEKRAWELSQGKHYSLVTILPGFLQGPPVTARDDSESTKFMVHLMNGDLRMGVAEAYYPMVDIRDVVDSHIAALENPSANGRYICSKETLSILDMAKMLREQYPEYSLPAHEVPKAVMYAGAWFLGRTWHYIRHNVGIRMEVDNSRIRTELGIQFARPFKQTLVDMVERLIEFGLIERKGAAASQSSK